MVREYLPFFFCVLVALLPPPPSAAAQGRPRERAFASVHDEIRYYLTEEQYTARRADTVWVDEEALERARFLCLNHEGPFIEQAREQLDRADDAGRTRLIGVLMRMSGTHCRPLRALFSPDSFETTYRKAAELRAALARRVTPNFREPRSIYAVEALAALGHRPAVRDIISFLNDESNPDVTATLAALAELDADSELATYLQQKVLEDLCIGKGHNVRDGARTELITQSLRAAADDRGYRHAPRFRALLRNVDWQPDDRALARYAVEGASERLRGHAVLLLSHHRDRAALDVILDRLQHDPSALVQSWAAQSFAINPNSRAVDVLVAVYERSEDYEVRFGCVEGLGNIGGQKAAATLRKALGDRSEVVRDVARWRLEHLSVKPGRER